MTTQILLSQLDSDKQRISYRKDWNKITGSVTATILLQQTYYWYQKNEFKPFYKFKSAPGKPHKLYNPEKADNWCNELGFTEREFDGAIKKVGFKYTSKTKDEKHDKFIEYWTDSSRVTHYKLNMVNFLTALLDLYLTNNLSVSKTTKGDLAKLQIDIYQTYKLDFSKSTKSDLPITETTQRLPETTTENKDANEFAPKQETKPVKKTKDVFEAIPDLKSKIGPKHYTTLNEIAQDKETYLRLKALWPDGKFSLLTDWLEYRKETRKHMTGRAIKMSLKTIEEFTSVEIEKAIQTSIQNGYVGFFPKRIRSERVAIRQEVEQNLAAIFTRKPKTATA